MGVGKTCAAQVLETIAEKQHNMVGADGPGQNMQGLAEHKTKPLYKD